MMYVSQIITVYIINLYSVKCQLYLNKTRREKFWAYVHVYTYIHVNPVYICVSIYAYTHIYASMSVYAYMCIYAYITT